MRYSVRSIFLATLLVAFSLASFGAVRRVLRWTPHEYAIDQVNGRDGWAREEADGVVADLNGYTCPIGDKSLKELVGCQRLRKLTAYKTNVTDNGLIYLSQHKNLEVLHLDDCPGITNGAILHLSKFLQLRELSVTGTKITEQGLQLLHDSLPDCTINPKTTGLAAH